MEVFRVEQKYILSYPKARDLADRISAILPRDANSGPDGYKVRSLYFDTVFDKDKTEKDIGIEKRRKIRLRIYNADISTAKLEVKEKSSQYQRKRSVKLPAGDALSLCRGDYEFLGRMQSALALEIYSLMTTQMYRPKCIVEYDRVAFVGNFNEVRITFDSNLKAGVGNPERFSGDPVLIPSADPGIVTLEVKYNGFLPTYIKSLIDTVDRSATSASKYIACRRII